MQEYTKKSTQTLLTHQRITILEDTITLPDGSDSTYIRFANTKNAVTILAIDEKDRILLNHEYTYPSGDYLYQLPAGEIDGEEEPLVAAKRELLEETGYTAENYEYLGWTYTNHRRSTTKDHLFLATNLKHVADNKEASELIEILWLPIKEFQKKVITNQIHHFGTLAAWAHYLNRLYITSNTHN